ncbi:troponin I isoform X3 [Drosophila subpulchrella]|uniref:troponin I isoform X3 n=1 Tax=Drosophila subpulchrella TaxID=1486046 RepID=UPI0018A199F1|nr:troponin I isoform X3 [Drosophila subpulchrella]
MADDEKKAAAPAAAPAAAAKPAAPAAAAANGKAPAANGKAPAAAAAAPPGPPKDPNDPKVKAEEAKKAKQAEIERKRAEVRKRMEEASKAKKAKKGFMTPERKKKLRLLLRKKAAEELKKEQERKAAERRRIIEERCGSPRNLSDASEAELQTICKQYWQRVYLLEGDKFDLEHVQKVKAQEINDLNAQVNDLRGKFVKPALKKVSKYENKFAKLQKKAAEFNFRNQLKVVKKKEFTLEEEEKEKKPDWSKGKPGDAKVKEEVEAEA